MLTEAGIKTSRLRSGVQTLLPRSVTQVTSTMHKLHIKARAYNAKVAQKHGSLSKS